MSPRKTRRGMKIEAADERLPDSEAGKATETPEASRTLRSRRQLKQKSSNDTEAEQTPSLNETKRVTRRANKSVTATELFNDNSVVNTTVLSTRKASKRDTVTTENLSTNQSVMSESKNPRSRKRKVNKNTDDTENHVEDGVLSHQLLQDDENLGGGSNDHTEIVVPPKKGRKKNIATPSNSKFIELRGRCVNSPGSVVTPESSPLVIDLTPHRTTKTPRKSPINLGSPKTHSISPQRHSKTPRKLPIVADSPETSDNTSSNGTSPKLQSTESPVLRESTRRAAVSPKRALRSLKSESPRVVAKKVRKSPKNTSRLSTKLSRAQLSQKSQSLEANTLDNMTRSPQLVLRRISPIKSPESSEVTPVLTPNMLKRQTEGGESPKRPKSTAKKRSSVTSSGTPLRPVATPKGASSKKLGKALGGSNTPLPTLTTMQAGLLVSSTPRERIRRSLNLSPPVGTSDVAQKSADLSSCTVNVQKFYGRGSSTPMDCRADGKFSAIETRPLISVDDTFNISGVKAVDSSRDSDTVMAEKSPSPLRVSLNDTYELDEPKTPGLKKKSAENDTYELEEPKTPGLRRKRNLAESSLSVTIDTNDVAPKRVCKVRFASPAKNTSVSKITMRRHPRSATPASKISSTRARVEEKSPKLTQVVQPRRRSNSLTLRKHSPPASGSKKRSSSVVNTGSRSASKQSESVNRLSRPRQSILSEKKETKTLSARKAPNFAQIHQKKFAKMESLVDAKKRVEERHNALTSNNVMSSASKTSHSSNVARVAPSQATNGNFNRFGFKVRKEEATKIVSKQPGIKKSDDKIEQRTVLKGVRSNRRFELQMKMRNLTS